MKRSQTCQNAISELYAVMAKVAAQRAVNCIKEAGHTAEAERLAETVIEWLDKSSAQAIRWAYDRPRPSLP